MTTIVEEATRPFRFEDLEGKPEPESWGPIYPKTASAAVEKWRKIANGRDLTNDESHAYGAAVHAWINNLNAPKKTPNTLPTTSNCASGQTGDFSAKKHRATLIAKLHCDANADRRRRTDREIEAAYALAMKEKRAREVMPYAEAA